MKQQMLALLRGEDLPEGAQGREVAEVPYEVPSVPKGETTCPVCRQTFKSHHRVRVHIGVHRGEKFPCGKCGKVLASKRYWRDYTQSCVKGKTVACPVCKKPFASAQSMHKHHKAQHGADSVVPEGGFVCPFCGKSSKSKRHGVSTSHIVLITLTRRGLIFVGCWVYSGGSSLPQDSQLELPYGDYSWVEGEAGVTSWIGLPIPCLLLYDQSNDPQ